MKKSIKNLILISFTSILFFCGSIGVKAINYISPDSFCTGNETMCCKATTSSEAFADSIGAVGSVDITYTTYIYKDADNRDVLGCEAFYDCSTGSSKRYCSVPVSCSLTKVDDYKEHFSSGKDCSGISLNGKNINIMVEGHLPDTPGNNACEEAEDIISNYEAALQELEECQKLGNSCDRQSKDYSDAKRDLSDAYKKMQNDATFDLSLECYTDMKNIVNNMGGGGSGGGSAECGILTPDLSQWLLNILKLIRYIGPALLIILSIMDFIKAIASSKDEEVKKANNRFIKRLIAIVLLFIFPLLVEFILKVFNVISTDPFCGLV